MYKSKREFLEENYKDDPLQEGRQLLEAMDELFLTEDETKQEEEDTL